MKTAADFTAENHHAPSVERKDFNTLERRYDASSADDLLRDIERFMHERKERDPAWLYRLREESLTKLGRFGLPTPRLERWKYTNLIGLASLAQKGIKHEWECTGTAKANSLNESDLPAPLSKYRAVFVDGDFRQDLSQIPDFIEICGAASAHLNVLEEHWNNAPADAFNDQMQWLLNSLYAKEGLVFRVPGNTEMDAPLELLSMNTHAHIYHPRHVIELEYNAKGSLIEHTLNMGDKKAPVMLNNACHIAVGPNCNFTHYKVMENNSGDILLNTSHITLRRDSHYSYFGLNGLNEHLRRDQFWIQMQGQNAECYVNGVQLALHDRQNEETVITVEHEAAHCQSNQDYRHLAGTSGAAHFQGKVHVHREAQKTEAYQMSRGILLSPRAQINTKPELEIYADDVKCSHGATTGEMDEKALFYMRSRGLPEREAKKLLIRSFVMEVFDNIEHDAVRDYFEAQLMQALDKEFG